MEIITIKEVPVRENKRGVSARFLIDRQAVVVSNVVLQDGEAVPTHITPVDVFFHVLEGRGTVEIGEESQVVSEGQIIVSPANIPHSLKANQGKAFSVLVVKTPNPDKTS